MVREGFEKGDIASRVIRRRIWIGEFVI